MYALHGFAPGEVVPTTALLLAHKHADDRARTEGRLQAVLATGEPFCCRHRIVDAAGRVHTVLSLAEGTCDETGTVVSVQGYFIDVTDSLRRAVDEAAHEAVARAAETRAVIEQAKGILMGIYRIDADAAFDLLRWHSQQTNTKVRLLADGLVRHFSESASDELSAARRLSDFLGLPDHTGRPGARAD
jgi:flavin-binding protein dodecin